MSHVEVGDRASDFSLPPVPGPERITLSGLRGPPVVIRLFPLAFSRVCTTAKCRMAEDWTRWSGVGAKVLAISVDSPFVNRESRVLQETLGRHPPVMWVVSGAGRRGVRRRRMG